LIPFVNMKITAPNNIVAGRVITQAPRIERPTPHLTFFHRSAVPAPIIEELTTWVVDTGPPSIEAVRITAADETWAVNPSTGFNL
jgi:hypothetical protein